MKLTTKIYPVKQENREPFPKLAFRGGGVPSYLGQISTRTLVPKSFVTGNKQFMSRRYMYARDNIFNLQIVIPNWYVNSPVAGGPETNPGGTMTVKASIEYPAGTFHQILFSGNTSMVISDGATGISDILPVNIPNGNLFYVRIFGTCTAGIVFSAGSNGLCDITNGDALVVGASGVVDQTMGGTVSTAGGSGTMFTAAAVIGMTNRPSIFLMGDSRVMGLNDSPSDISGDLGEVARSIGSSFAYINCGIPTDQAQNAALVGNYSKRGALVQYCTHIINNYGINDFVTGARTASQLQADTLTIRALFPNLPFYSTTVGPRVSVTTDGWTSLSGQTVHPSHTQCLAWNNTLRAGVPQFSGYFETADQWEDTRSGKYQVGTVRLISDFAISTSTPTTLTSATANFTNADLWRAVAVAGAGAAGIYLDTIITAVTNSTTVTVQNSAQTTVSGAVGGIGTYSIDGIHEVNQSYLAIKNSGCINTSLFHYP